MVKKKLSGSEKIRVVIRCRDLLPFETERGDKALVKLDLATNQVIVQHPIGDADIFAFDAVYNNSFTQRDIFLQEVQPLADAVLQGYNSTVFAYGQSGSGKTHTMTGNLSDRQLWGMMPQVVDYLFKEMNGMTSATKTFKVRVSYVELYNGKSRDLLTSKQVNLEIKQNMSGNFYVKGAEMPEITCLEDAIRLFNAGTERRQVASTELNDTSSRSHALFTVQIEQFDFEQDPSAPVAMTSKINVVDLAGSEKLSKTGATGDTAKEGCNINLSLSALATVIDTIVKGGKHIPYRGSPLTMLLKDSLGGNAKTAMFANIGPSDRNSSETISTLRFALRAKQIENKPIKNMDPKDARIQELLDQIEELKGRIGNVDLNVEDNLRVRIEELEIENSDLRGRDDRSTLDLQEKVRTLHLQIEEAAKGMEEKQHDLSRQIERCNLLESNIQIATAHKRDLLSLNCNFIKRVFTDEQLAEARNKMPKDGSYNLTDDGWDVKEIGHYLHCFLELFEKWRETTFTQEDMEKYAHRAMEDLQAQVKRQMDDSARMIEELQRQKHEEATRRTADNEVLSQLKVESSALKEENAKLKEKIERDQEKIKAKLAKNKEEYKTLTDQLEAARGLVTQRERDVERLKRILEESGNQAVLNSSLSFPALSTNFRDADQSLFRQLEEERTARAALESKVKETNVSLRRYGVCIASPDDLEDDSVSAATKGDAFILAAAQEKPIDGDLFEQLQQQLRLRQRLLELQHRHQLHLDALVRRFEILKNGGVNPASAGSPLSQPQGIDEASAQKIMEAIQRKDDEIEQLRADKDQTCDKLVKKLNKCELKIKELESTLEDERAAYTDERNELHTENEELHAFNQKLALDLEMLRNQLDATKGELESTERTKDSEIQYLKSQVEGVASQLESTRNKAAEFDELQKSYDRIQQQLARAEAALTEKMDMLEDNRRMFLRSNGLLEQEQRRAEELEMVIRQQEIEMRRQEEAFRSELTEKVNSQVAANNRRLESQAAQFQDLIAQEQEKHRSVQKKLKNIKSSNQKVARRYDEMILENEALLAKFEQLKETSMKLYREKQEAQRDLDAFRPVSKVRAREL